MKKNQKGFTLEYLLFAGVIVVIVAAAIVLALSHHKKTNTASSTRQNSQTQTSQKFLDIKELGVRFKLSTSIDSAYYQVKSSSRNGKPIIALYLHSLDAYSSCAPDNNLDGVAEVLTYTPGTTDPVVGNYSTSYPNAPLIDGLYYYIANEQSDCSKGQASNMSAIGQAFTAAYPTIEKH